MKKEKGNKLMYPKRFICGFKDIRQRVCIEMFCKELPCRKRDRDAKFEEWKKGAEEYDPSTQVTKNILQLVSLSMKCQKGIVDPTERNRQEQLANYVP